MVSLTSRQAPERARTFRVPVRAPTPLSTKSIGPLTAFPPSLIHRPDQAPVDEGVIPWFYRTLRNATIDRFRRQGTANRALEAFAHELERHASPDAEMEAEICGCVARLADSLKPEYAEALRSIEMNGTPVKTFAEQHGLSASNAGVRVHRAREALKKRVVESCGTCADHGCRNCNCTQR